MHLVIDGFGGDIANLGDSDFIYLFLDSYPDTINMTKITPPHVYTYNGQKPEDWGISGFVLIAESHISIHTFPDRGYANIDVFSCMNFDTQKAVTAIQDTFGFSQLKSWTLDRGLDYSTPEQAFDEMDRERTELTISPTDTN